MSKYIYSLCPSLEYLLCVQVWSTYSLYSSREYLLYVSKFVDPTLYTGLVSFPARYSGWPSHYNNVGCLARLEISFELNLLPRVHKVTLLYFTLLYTWRSLCKCYHLCNSLMEDSQCYQLCNSLMEDFQSDAPLNRASCREWGPYILCIQVLE